jgi:hypothetical protein
MGVQAPPPSIGNQAMLRLQRKCDCGGAPDCDCDTDKTKERKQHKGGLHRATDGSGTTLQSAPPIVHDTLRSPGAMLDPETRAFFEARFGEDFSGVRIHTDSRAAESARAVNATAYTVGRNIAFAPGSFAPATTKGRRLLAHELTHTLQQPQRSDTTTSPDQAQLSVGAPDDQYEQEAEQVADRVLQAADPARPMLGSQRAETATDAATDAGAATGFRQGPSAQAGQVTLDGGSGVVQREPLASYNPTAADQTPDYSQMTWQQLLPSARGATGGRIANIDLHTPDNQIDKWGTGQAPTLTYKPDKNISVQTPSATPQIGVGGTADPEADAVANAQTADFKAAQDAVIAKIKDARAKIPARSMGRSINNNAGYDYNPDTDPAAKDYNQWVKSALPAKVAASDWNWQVFQRIKQLEGQEGRFTTFDKTLSVGPGFSSSGGQTQQVIGKTFSILPEVTALALDAGLIVDAKGEMSVVDVDKRWILSSQDAMAYLQTDVSLLSLLVNVSQGTQPVDASGTVAPDQQTKQRQALLEVEWQQFLNGTLANLPSSIKSWSLDSAVLAVHAKHAQPGNFSYGFWNASNSPDLTLMVRAIYDKVGDSAKYICTGPYAGYH